MAHTTKTAFLLLSAAVLPSGCSLFAPAEREFLSNEAVLASAAEAAGYAVDGGLYRLVGVDLREDSVTFQYRGVKLAGDHAWVVRFSEKSSEQDPTALADVYSLLPVLKESRPGFAITEEGSKEAGRLSARFVRYRFESPIRDGLGKPLPAHGIVASVRAEASGTPLVYQLKLDNHGDRDDVAWEDLAPFVDAIAGR